MQVILLERIEKLGFMGDEVVVKTGFARNYLLPQKKALRATDANRKFFEQQKAQLEADNLKLKKDAEAVAKKMDDLTLVLIRQAGESGHLYGSVTIRDIADKAAEAGFTINKQQIKLSEPIKTLGLHKARVVLHPEVSLWITLNVALSEEEAKAQLKESKAPEAKDLKEEVQPLKAGQKDQKAETKAASADAYAESDVAEDDPQADA